MSKLRGTDPFINVISFSKTAGPQPTAKSMIQNVQYEIEKNKDLKSNINRKGDGYTRQVTEHFQSL
jgi:hypothetical protein